MAQVVFDTSKKEMLNPNQGFKKFVKKLKSRYNVSAGWLCLAANHFCFVRPFWRN